VIGIKQRNEQVDVEQCSH
jgi:hypothetical protein